MELVYIKNDIKRERGKIVCPHNPECRCERMTCDTCGWHPSVAQARLEDFQQKRKEALV